MDVVIPAHGKDFDVLQHAIAGARRFLRPAGRIYVVSALPPPLTGHVEWIAEPGGNAMPSLAEVRSVLAERGPAAAARAGWLYQQLLKLGAARYILGLEGVWMSLDADVMFLRPVHMPVAEVRFPYTYGFEFHAPYLEAYERLFRRPTAVPFSFTAHQMVCDRELLEEMFAEIETIQGVPWWVAYLNAVDDQEQSSISELDIYGHWVLGRHPELARHHQLHYLNVHVVPGPVGRALFARDFDFVAAHAWMRRARWWRAAQASWRLAVELRARWAVYRRDASRS